MKHGRGWTKAGAGQRTLRLSSAGISVTSCAMQAPEKADMHSEAFLHSLMRKQLRLSILCAGAFLTALLGLPLANYFYPEFMATRVFGFTLLWLILGIGFFPAVWVIAWFFVRRSIALEESQNANEEIGRNPE